MRGLKGEALVQARSAELTRLISALFMLQGEGSGYRDSGLLGGNALCYGGGPVMQGLMLGVDICKGSSEIGMGSGGAIRQEIHADQFGAAAWSNDFARLYVRMVDPQLWEAITGERLPPSPIPGPVSQGSGWVYWNRFVTRHYF